jgi:hypothetical protein
MTRSAARGGNGWLTLALVLAVDLIVFVPRLAFQNLAGGGFLDAPPTRSPLPGVAYELGLLFGLLALTAGTRARNQARVVATVVFAVFLLLSLYHEAYMRIVYFAPAIVDDWRLLLNLWHFVQAASDGVHLFAGFCVLAYVGAIALAAFTFRRVQDAAAGIRWRACAAGAGSFAVGGAILVLAWPRGPIIQWVSDGLAANLRSSRIALERWRSIAETPPDTRYDGFAKLPLPRRPNVYLLVIEAYGEALATCSSKTAYHQLLDRMEARLARSGFQARSGYSVAPIFGARSWLSVATLQTGVHIGEQAEFRVLEQNAPRIPTLTSFFQAHGYYTMMLQPLDAPRFGVEEADLYRRDRGVINADLPYRGPHLSLAGVPDQYSLGFFEEHFLRAAPAPRFVSYMAVSTHYMWWSPGPFVRDWHRLDGPVGPDDLAPWEPIPGRAEIGDQRLLDYFTTVEYEWRALADFIEARREEDALLVLVGDHQPRLSCGPGPLNYDTVVHVLSRDQGLVDRFADVGLTPGLFAEPGQRPPLKHEGLFSLLVAKLTGAPAATTYAPAGIHPSGLRR